MKSGTSNATWVGDINFLISKTSCWSSETRGQNPISWDFRQFTGTFFPFFFFECKITGFGLEAFGHSVERCRQEALKKAFAEAWERLWLKRVELDGTNEKVFSSNGFAAGSTDNMAIQKSKEELIERAILLIAWQEKTGWNKTQINHFRNKLVSIGLALRGWKTYLYKINSNAGSVLIGFIMHKQLGVIFDSCFHNEESEQKLIMSLAKNSFFQQLQQSYFLQEDGIPDDHRKFYSVPSNSVAFEFLLKGEFSDNIIELKNVESIVTTLLCSAGNFPAVARATNSNWPELTWGTQSIKGVNLWPHPLA